MSSHNVIFRHLCLFTWISTVAFLFTTVISPTPTAAQTKPRIMLLLDSSGSMAWDMSGVNTKGDGSRDPWGAGRECCPGYGGSRMEIAKDAMRQMILSSGDIEFSLAKFPQYYDDGTVTWTSWATSNQYDENQAANANDRLRYDGRGDYSFAIQSEWLCVDFGPGGTENNSAEMLMWVDHHEFTGFDTVDTNVLAADGWEQELRADGGTPLGAQVREAAAHLITVQAADPIALIPGSGCRPYSVVVLSDGAQSDFDPTNDGGFDHVADMYTNMAIETYVIGLAFNSATLDNIATSGSGGARTTAYLANSEEELSSILYTIISSSILVETCDGADNNCNCPGDTNLDTVVCGPGDDGVDEGFTLYCDKLGEYGPATSNQIYCTAPSEECNGIDDNCDGFTDEGTWSGAPAGDPCGSGVGECQQGALQCEKGTGWVCAGSISAGTEICDGLDNNCDGQTDEGLVGGACGDTNVGECALGTWQCTAGSWTCTGALYPVSEGMSCDGLDNDCDTEIDEGVSQTCGGGAVNGAPSICREGVQYCNQVPFPGEGWMACSGDVGSGVETCNGLDDDCDGTVDNNLTDTGGACGGGPGADPNDGECAEGAWACAAGVLSCNGETGPTAEGIECDGLDNDCDGETDEGIVQACGGGPGADPNWGVCQQGVQSCDAAASSPGSPVWLACLGDISDSPELCDSLDNDCDNSTDESATDVGNPCGGAPTGDPNEGACAEGSTVCTAGVIECQGDTGPAVESCDDIDNDCDTETDEGLYQVCGGGGGADPNEGACQTGMQQCSTTGPGWEACIGSVSEANEVCNGIDDDCDAAIDEAINPVDDPAFDQPCGVGACSGNTICTAGAIVCDNPLNPGDNPETCDNVDEDCDGSTDEGLTLACGGADPNGCDPGTYPGGVCPDGSDQGFCVEGLQVCAAGAWGSCQGNTDADPAADMCDGVDRDCDGLTDEDETGGAVCDTGICEGATACVNGAMICQGGQTATTESCNGLDDNCDSSTDEGLAQACGGGPLGFENEGICVVGSQTCDSASASPGVPVWNACVGETNPSGEVCDGLDNDCDSVTDDNIFQSCGGGPGGDPEEGACRLGIQACGAGSTPGFPIWDACQGNVDDTPEICDGIDNDCDGATDEGINPVDDPAFDQPCGTGACAGNTICTAGAIVCDNPLNPGDNPETCDNVDEDCDGSTDEGLTLACGGADPNGCDPGTYPGGVCPDGSDQGFCVEGLQVCAAGAWGSCQGNTDADPAADMCDGVDRDCDGLTDEDETGGAVCDTGICEGATACVNGAMICQGGQTATTESCNGLDDNCDSSTDEGLAQACGGGPLGFENEGICVVGSQTCDSASASPGVPVWNACVGETNPSGEVCDGLDNDCDSVTDDNIFQSCGGGPGGDPEEGACRLGIQACGAGSTPGFPIWDACQGNVDDTPEICDGIDNDCDGATDEGINPVDDPAFDQPCGTGACAGNTICTAGAIVCDNPLNPGDNPETCDNVDEDCDGSTDEGLTLACGGADPNGCDPGTYPGGVCPDGSDQGFCVEGLQVCAAGAWGSCQGNTDADPAADMCDGVDRDCDGLTDEDETGGAVCDTGICEGATACVNGAMICQGGQSATTESCNGLDDNCDSSTDEGLAQACGGGPLGFENEGICVVGSQTCDSVSATPSVPVWNACVGNTDPSSEVCDGLDNDCDSVTDDNVFQSCGGGTGGDPEEGTCRLGIQACGAGSTPGFPIWDACQGNVDEMGEVCDGLDNDCDGQTDESINPVDDPSFDQPCGTGACAGTTICTAGAIVCDMPVNPGDLTESCNTVDDDCDGVTDEDTSVPCGGADPNGCDPGTYPGGVCPDGADQGFCVGGFQICVAGSLSGCQGNSDPDPAADMCDGVDRDCDGLTDEDETGGAVCNTGVCEGITACVNGTVLCQGGGSPSGESCNGLDDNCDGTTDEGVSRTCGGGPLGHENDGICVVGSQTCDSAASTEFVAVWNACVGNTDPGSEVCDGLDNDCDGIIDDNVFQACGGGPGADPEEGTCRQGIQACGAGATPGFPVWDACQGNVDDMPETCDGLDNDCDASTDESINQVDDPQFGAACGEGVCAGTNICTAGVLTCDMPVNPGDLTETCNALDDDCDGVTDEGTSVPCGGADPNGCDPGTYAGGVCPDGADQGFCVGGFQICVAGSLTGCQGNSDPDPAADMCDGVDRDCDGLTDEDETGGAVCNTGVCEGITACVAGTVLCQGGGSPSGESCNGLDDNCDGATDEGLSRACGGGPLGHENDGICIVGSQTCDSAASTEFVSVWNACVGNTDPGSEICDGLDNDCDGNVDDNVFQACGGGPGADPEEGACRQGVQACGIGAVPGSPVWDACQGNVDDTGELCDGLDNDCDGATDEAIDPLDEPLLGQSCGSCDDGTWACQAGDLVCNGASSPDVESCDGLDNDCDGLTDEGVTQPCGATDVGQCQFGAQECDPLLSTPGVPVWKACIGEVPASQELCDDLDNDCDGTTDEESEIPTVNDQCQAAVGICDYAELRCALNGSDVKEVQCCASVAAGYCVSPQSAMPEVCDGLDNNCNGIPDEGLVESCGGCDSGVDTDFSCPLGTEGGECALGFRYCTGGVFGACQGDVGPIPEVCNSLDDDCDGETDENVQFATPDCSLSQTADPWEGICEQGTWDCVSGVPVCNGTGPAPETCNGLDDDCDGETDEVSDLAEVGQICRFPLGICEVAHNYCLNGSLQCCTDDTGGVCTPPNSPVIEDCNGLDDNCDGLIDNDVVIAGTCSNSQTSDPNEGICTEGSFICIDGAPVCNSNMPTTEICDGKDNDCNGEIDEGIAAECPGGLCLEGQCAEDCAGIELACPPGKVCTDVNGERACLSDVCSPSAEDSLPCASNEYWCDDGFDPPCHCEVAAQICADACHGVQCAAGSVCVTAAGGKCMPIEEDCYATGCPTGELCIDGTCAADTCDGIVCGAGEYCTDKEGVGTCVSLCDETITCQPGQGCFEGQCIDDPCVGVLCDNGFDCVDGACTLEDICFGVDCEFYEVCEEGECVGDPCWDVNCPNGMYCSEGACYTREYVPAGGVGGENNNDTDSDATHSDDTDDPTTTAESDISALSSTLATGSGGCVCSTSPGASTQGSWTWILASLMFMGVLLRRRVRRIPVLLIIAGTLVFASCSVDPYNLADKDGWPSDVYITEDGGDDITLPDDTESEDTDPTDDTASSPICDPDADDNQCDGVDDDCDGQTDEDVDTASNPYHCGGCMQPCDYDNAFPECANGTCGMGDCAAYWQDLNSSDTDGCEYFCQTWSDTDACDGVDLLDTDNPYAPIDADCDGQFDEDVDFDGDPNNCGRCGYRCQFPNADALCNLGACQLGPCKPDYHDDDTNATNGCEYYCQITSAVELCNGLDDNCDGQADEGNPEGGSLCYTGASGCAPDGTNCEGICVAGTQQCVGGLLTCVGEVHPNATEQCNDLDDDCDGLTDEESDIPQMGDAADGGALCGVAQGACSQGRQRCALVDIASPTREPLCCDNVDGSGVCVPPVQPGSLLEDSPAHCDGVDNDCDGVTDEVSDGACYYGQAHGDAPATQGECFGNPGTWNCNWGLWVCNGETNPQAEACDGLDNDCDGSTDENVIQSCGGADPAGCDPGTYPGGACPGGATEGECQLGYQTCDPASSAPGAPVYGACVNDRSASAELCDNLDNDCDGLTDENALGTGTSCGEGECAGNWICSSGSLTCDGASSTPEVCDGLDNDCDGGTDESISQACGGGLLGNENTGQCIEGIQYCDPASSTPGSPVWTSCDGNVDPAAETCDDLDNDCDGTTDEEADIANVGLDDGVTCMTAEGICEAAVHRCVDAGGSKSVGCCADVVAGACVEPQGPETEECDSIDNDCDGSTDEEFLLFGQSCGGAPGADPNEGECQQGTYVCSGGSISCQSETAPVIEGSICDSLDNDCDGATDEWVTEVCGGGPGADPNEGSCLQGFNYCGDPTCFGEVAPAAESCNGIDDDCDGTTDEGVPTVGDACGMGVCAGTIDCSAGALSCNGPAASAEVCDGIDNDCDGYTDENISQACGGGLPGNENTGQCLEGIQYCDPASSTPGFPVWTACNGNVDPVVETCDDLDNDCDGTTDEESDIVGVGLDDGTSCMNSDGICDGAVLRCVDAGGSKSVGCCADVVAGACVEPQGPETEECDGIDNDCDGATDEEFLLFGQSCGGAPGADPNEGECQQGTYSCDTGSIVCQSETAPVVEGAICDNLDNDCDGATDEWVTEVCGGGPGPDPNEGACLEGFNYCGDPTCYGEVAAATESCNAIDDDCDGTTDEGVPTVGDACGTGECSGTVDCSSGVLSCNGSTAVAEICDGLDNDCDGSTDENISQSCGGGLPGNENTGQCLQGIQYCDPVSSTPGFPVWTACDGNVDPIIETCDDLDNDCDGTTDEESDIVNVGLDDGTVCMNGVGICDAAVLRCVDAGGSKSVGCCSDVVAGACVEPQGPETEECDSIDNNCDGSTDESFLLQGDPCGGGPGADPNEGECTQGTYVCTAGSITCSGEVTPIAEAASCNTLDEDCDGDTDEWVTESCGGGPGADPNEGACQQGFNYCGDPTCYGEVADVAEVCNDVDDDCDGVTDDGVPTVGDACGVGACAGTIQCSGGSLSCNGAAAVAEVCDGLDNDCDGTTDDNVSQACGGGLPGNENTGQCLQGIQYCDAASATPGFPVWLACDGNVDPVVETCDGLDNDCDATTDEETDIVNVGLDDGTVCMSAVGICEAAVHRCVDAGGSKSVGCCSDVVAGACVVPQGPETEECDSIDNNCDGSTDESFLLQGDPCGGGPGADPNEGECTQGTYVCTAGSITCSGETTPIAEAASCNTLDDDCDGDTDEWVTESCGGGPGADPNEGACQQGFNYCGDPTCYGEVADVAEVCNDVDDDCDGVTDDGVPTVGDACGVGACAGTIQCSGGSLFCNGSAPAAEVCDGLDNDCDGTTDDNVSQVCGGGLPGNENTGQCLQGIQYCDAASSSPGFPVWLACDGNVDPVVEACDGLDNDCDATIDEESDIVNVGLDDGTVCMSAVGICEAAVHRCVDAGGSKSVGCCKDVVAGACVTPQGPETEECDNIDNNCDGSTDETFLLQGDPCGGGPGADPDEGECAQGTYVCTAGSITCSGEITPIAEAATCNGLDEDCDADTDEWVTVSCGGGPGADPNEGACQEGFKYCDDPTCYGEIADVPEVCNDIDDDCDGTTDDGVPTVGDACGVGVCAGTIQCSGGSLSCNGSAPVAEICDGLDNDCDGSTDEGVSQVCGGGAGADPNWGICQVGVQFCDSATATPGFPAWLACEGNVDPQAGPDNCDGLDTNCDGSVDEDELTAGACGAPCNDGTLTCVSGVMQCVGASVPQPDICDNADNDCNPGTADGDAEPWNGALCDGGDADSCQEGTFSCVGGVQTCSDATGDDVEVCDGLDNDCDGGTDNGLTGPGGLCDTDCPVPMSEYCDGALGWKCDYDCTSEGGDVECDAQGQPVPIEGLCDSIDNNCDGTVDENLTNSIDHCGDCATDCDTPMPTGASAVDCLAGSCIVTTCAANTWDINATHSDGCEYSCTYVQALEICNNIDEDCDGQTDEGISDPEVCDGIDNDCDGNTDNGLTAPPGVCNPLCGGVATPVCSGVGGWDCDYTCVSEGGEVECDGGGDPLAEETLCDGNDNDCDGLIDEPFAGLGATCNRDCYDGVTRCDSTLSVPVCCDLSKQGSGAVCGAGNDLSGPTPADEDPIPNGFDEDCDGLTDEGLDSCVEYITVDGGGWSFEIFTHEASRYDATDTDPGSVSTVACSEISKLPWTSVDFDEATDACELLNDPAIDCVASPELCWEVCSAEQWQYACEWGGGVQTLYPYGPTYDADDCNGLEQSTYGGMLMKTGGLGTCIADWTPPELVDLYDLSGNVEEWTRSPRGAQYEIRGGSYNDVGPPSPSAESAMACTFDFWAAEPDFRMENLGFRCCRGEEPTSTVVTCADQVAASPVWSFEGSDEGWVLNNDWQQGQDTWAGAHDGTDVIGTSLNTTFARGVTSFATSPEADLSLCTPGTDTVSLWFAINTDFAENDAGDYAYFQIYDGASWLTVNTVNYPYDTGTRWNRDSDEAGWRYVQVDISNYVSSKFKVRFEQRTDGDTRVGQGTYIDNVGFSTP